MLSIDFQNNPFVLMITCDKKICHLSGSVWYTSIDMDLQLDFRLVGILKRKRRIEKAGTCTVSNERQAVEEGTVDYLSS